MTTRVEKSIDVEKPIHTVYNQWTQFESFPEFMKGVERVEQKDDKRLHWVAKIGMADREWDAEIVEQTPDQVIAWKASGETTNDGRVTFQEVAPNRTRVNLVLEYEPEDLVEKAGEKLGVVDKRVEGDLERFKSFIEERGVEEGAWRGEIHQ
ncbi:MAG: SRPBCC family protein [Egibacteraceae bacterium]